MTNQHFTHLINDVKVDKTPLHIVEATESDVPEMMDLQFAAYEGDPFPLSHPRLG